MEAKSPATVANPTIINKPRQSTDIVTPPEEMHEMIVRSLAKRYQEAQDKWDTNRKRDKKRRKARQEAKLARRRNRE